MIKFPHNMTVDDNTTSEEISFSAEHVRIQERERIIAILEKMSDTASSTETEAGTQTVWVIENAIALIKREKAND